MVWTLTREAFRSKRSVCKKITTNEKSWIGSRRLLQQLRDAMAGHGSARERLDRIVQLIARGMVAEVCSVYVLRPGDILELFAT